MRARRAANSAYTSRPSKYTVPESAGSAPLSARNSVDLPDPDGPTTPRKLEPSSAKLMLSTSIRPESVTTLIERATNPAPPVSLNSSRLPLRIRNRRDPMEMTSLAPTGALVTATPFTNVPLWLPRSTIWNPVPLE